MEADHVGCIMTIVGSRFFRGVTDWHIRATNLITEALDVHKPIIVISGGAVGIDQLAIRLATARGIATTEVIPKTFEWAAEGGLRERNTQMAEACQCCVRIYDPASATYGSGWTADYAERIGKHVERYPITNLTAAEIEEAKLKNQMARFDAGKTNYDPRQ
jgi:hypothetical protein